MKLEKVERRKRRKLSLITVPYDLPKDASVRAQVKLLYPLTSTSTPIELFFPIITIYATFGTFKLSYLTLKCPDYSKTFDNRSEQVWKERDKF